MIWISLFFFLFLLFLAVILIIVLLQKEKPLGNSTYRKKTSVMNESEQAFFASLQKTLGDRYLILSMVRVADFVEINEEAVPYKNRRGFLNRIVSKHVDFLICDRKDTKPLLAIELDGKSHSGYKKRERDQFVDGLYKGIDLPIEHIPTGANFEDEAIRLKDLLASKK